MSTLRLREELPRTVFILLVGKIMRPSRLLFALCALQLSAAAPSPQPLGPVKPGSPNIVLFLTDDMDYTLGGWAPMAQTTKLLSERGATATHWTVHTPVCCPSRTELITGRYFHNVKGADSSAKSCMHATPYPELAANEWLFAPHLRAAGYRVGVFGKWLNNYNPTNAEHGVETWFANGGGDYFNPTFAYDASASNPPGGGKNVQFSNASAPGAAYSTSVIGNISVPWVRVIKYFSLYSVMFQCTSFAKLTFYYTCPPSFGTGPSLPGTLPPLQPPPRSARRR